jgi:hypothetical protein
MLRVGLYKKELNKKKRFYYIVVCQRNGGDIELNALNVGSSIYNMYMIEL